MLTGCFERLIPFRNLNGLRSEGKSVFIRAVNIVMARNLMRAPNGEVPTIAVMRYERVISFIERYNIELGAGVRQAQAAKGAFSLRNFVAKWDRELFSL